MDLQGLNIFVQVAELNSFTKKELKEQTTRVPKISK